MSLRVGDTVLVHINDESHSQRIGILEYIGYIDSDHRSKFVGINLVESVSNGHNGSINNKRHFKAPNGHGIYVRTENIIKKLDSRQLTLKMQQIVMLFKDRLNEYVSALAERDEYIEELKSEHKRLKKLMQTHSANINSKTNPSSNSNSLHTIEELMASPPPINKMECDKSKKNQRKKHCHTQRMEYTKYESDTDNIDSNDDSDSESDTENEIDSNVSTNDESIVWCEGSDDFGYKNMNSSHAKYGLQTPISISTQSQRNSHSQSQSRVRSKNNKYSNRYNMTQKSHSTHNTPHHSPTVHSAFHRNIPNISMGNGNGNGNAQSQNKMSPYSIQHQTSFSGPQSQSQSIHSTISPYNGSDQSNHTPRVYHPNSGNMAQLYDMMLSQQTQIQMQRQNKNHGSIRPMQPISHTHSVPNEVHVTGTKRRSLHKIKPIPELRERIKNNRNKNDGLALQNRRSNSVDMGYHFSDVNAILKNQVNHPKIKYRNGAGAVNNGIVKNNQWIAAHNQQHTPPSMGGDIYIAKSQLNDHFSAYF